MANALYELKEVVVGIGVLLKPICDSIGDSGRNDCTIAKMLLDMSTDISTIKESCVSMSSSTSYINSYVRRIDNNVYATADYWINSNKGKLTKSNSQPKAR